MKRFKERYTFEERKQEALRILKKYPDRIPVIVQRDRDQTPLKQQKFLCPDNLTVAHFMFMIRKRIKVPSTHALFMFVNNTVPPNSELLYKLYQDHKEPCGFLYCDISEENTFGC